MDFFSLYAPIHYQAYRTGNGIGVEYDIVKAHGGELKVNSKEAEGSEFLIFLPYI